MSGKTKDNQKRQVQESKFRCIDCGYEAKSSLSLSVHQSQHCKGPAQLVGRQRIKRRRHPSQPVSVVHSVVAHGTKVKRDSKQKQDRAVSYTANCTWNRPSLAALGLLCHTSPERTHTHTPCGRISCGEKRGGRGTPLLLPSHLQREDRRSFLFTTIFTSSLSHQSCH